MVRAKINTKIFFWENRHNCLTHVPILGCVLAMCLLILTLSTLEYNFHALYLKSACQNLHYINCFNGTSEELINHEYTHKEI